MFFVFDSNPDSLIVSEDPFFKQYCSNRYKTQRMCDEAIDDSLAASKFITDWFAATKMINKLHTAWYEDDNIPYFNEDSGDVTIFL